MIQPRLTRNSVIAASLSDATKKRSLRVYTRVMRLQEVSPCGASMRHISCNQVSQLTHHLLGSLQIGTRKSILVTHGGSSAVCL